MIATSKSEIVDTYFNNSNPDAQNDVLRALFAYGFVHFREHPEAHLFNGPWRDCRCEWCNMSREEVRWCEELPYRCQKRPEWINKYSIEDILTQETQKYEALLERGKTEIPKFIKKHGLTGETLSVLFHTYGHTPDEVADHFIIPDDVKTEYDQLMEIEKQRSLIDNNSKKKVIQAKLQ